ncbi:MAG: hypothetical protein GQ477_01750 [Nanohaloarchaea archaeon]|nr:hypothetical protein [Candidatus Nanohaloarchaea archaeon]
MSVLFINPIYGLVSEESYSPVFSEVYLFDENLNQLLNSFSLLGIKENFRTETGMVVSGGISADQKKSIKKSSVLSIIPDAYEYGLVSLNTNRSIYRPGETAEFTIVVLDRHGSPVCDAEIFLSVLDPDNGTAEYSVSDGTIFSVDGCGGYKSHYSVYIEGNHTVDVAASVDSVELLFLTYFLVSEEYVFDIIRTADHNIDPTKVEYFNVKIDIESFAESDTLTIRESVPAEFDVISDAYREVNNDTKVLIWNKDLIENKTSVSYSYSVPNIWPNLYDLGPLEINYGSQAFTEVGAWYVAVDPSSIYISTCSNLNTTGATYYLTQNISNSTAINCMNISANNVTLDCQGHTIDGNSTIYTRGVYIYRESATNTNTTIKNCIITDWYRGVYLINAKNNTMTNNTANDNTYGFCMDSGSDNTLTNNTASSGHYGFYLQSSSNNTLTSNTAKTNTNGFYLKSSTNNTITSNTPISNNRGFYLGLTSNNNTLTNNVPHSNNYGIYMFSSFNNNITGNTISDNSHDIYDGDGNTFLSNNFLHNPHNKMIIVSVSEQAVNINDLAEFNISVYYPDGTVCSDFTYNISTRPEETIYSSISGNNITGNFTVTRPGFYSLVINITDDKNNTVKRSYAFLVNSTGIGKVNYYFRGVTPTHGQPASTDAKSFLFIPPSTEEFWTCGVWIQASPDELGVFTPNIIENINLSFWYKTDAEGYIGIERYFTFGEDVDYNQTVPIATDYTWSNRDFSVSWPMDYTKTWYWMAMKLGGHNPYWMTNATDPSYLNITYNYTTTPEIKNNINEDIKILSATIQAADILNNATIYLEGVGNTNLTVQMPNTTILYYAIGDGVYCNNENCTYTQSSGELNFTLTLDSEYTIDIEGDVNIPPSVQAPVTYDNFTTAAKTIFSRTEGMTVRINVTDENGASDISRVLLEILNTTGNCKVCNETMTNITGITNGYTYESNYTIPSDADGGTWTVNVYANDSAGDFGINTATFDVYLNTDILQVTINNSNPNRGDAVLIRAKLAYDNTTEIADQNITFYYNTTQIGSNLTNSTGWGIITWNTIDVSGGTYTINATYNGNSTPWTKASHNDTEQVTVTAPNLKVYNAAISPDEAESSDTITSINITINNTGDSNAVDVNITLSFLYSNNTQVISWGPQNEYNDSCGTLSSGQICSVLFTSYQVNPGETISGAYKLNITSKWSTGSNVNETFMFTVYHMPDNISSTISPAIIVPGELSNYTISVTNPWSSNLLNVNVTSACPLGITCTCESDNCGIGTITPGNTGTKKIIVNASESEPGDYNLSAYVNYTNPNSNTYQIGPNWNQILTKPAVQFVSPTTQAGTYLQNYIEANATAKGGQFDTLTIYLYNSTGLYQSNQTLNTNMFVNFTSLPEGTYYLNATANDTAANINMTETRTIAIDAVSPYYISGCTELDEAGAIYYLIADIINSDTFGCMDITANNVILDCQGHIIDGDDDVNYGIDIYRSSVETTNITVRNCVLSDWDMVNIRLYKADGNNLTNITLTSSTNAGISIQTASYNNFTDCTANSNENYGFYTSLSSNSNTFTNCTANSNDDGFYLDGSSGNTFTNCTAKENNIYDFYISISLDSHCNNKIENMTGSNDLPIKYFNDTVILANETLSELILCNADNSVITNITVNASQMLDNNEIYVLETSNATFTNIISSDNYRGFYFSKSSFGNIIINATANSNNYGFYIYSSNSNNFTDCTANSNNYDGFYIIYSDLNTITNSSVNSNVQYGFLFRGDSDSNTIANATIANNSDAGLWFDEYFSNCPKYNIIYNNLFNNSVNVLIDDSLTDSNYFNTTKQMGTRTYSSGNQIGGNYYTDPTGNGHSDTCTDSNYDGFCDEAYDLSVGISAAFDYLPLSDKYDGVSPTYAQNSTSTIVAGAFTQFSLKWNDNMNLTGGGFIFSWYNGSNSTKDSNSGDKESEEQSFYAQGLPGFSDYADMEINYGNWTSIPSTGCAWYWGIATSSGSTGPQNGGVGGTGTYFTYVESSDGYCYTSGNTATFLSREFDWDDGLNDEIEFYYNMYGSSLGTLYLEENSTGSWVELWSRSGDDGGSGLIWTKVEENTSSLSGKGHVRFRNVAAGSWHGDTAIDRLNISGDSLTETEKNKTAVEYTDVISNIYEIIYNITVTVNVSYYSTSGSTENGNTNAALWLEVYNGSVWVDEGNLQVTSTGNFSKIVTTSSILAGWQTESNRDIRISARYLDYSDSSHFDAINWTDIWIESSSEGKFKNDTLVTFSSSICSTDTVCWSNVTKTVNSTVGATIKWKVHAKDNVGNWNASEEYSYVTAANTAPIAYTPSTYDNSTSEAKTVFARNKGMTVRVNITDENGAGDISTVLIEILNTTSGVIVNNETMTQDDSIMDGYVYNYSWQVPSDADGGIWTINIYANDSVNILGSNMTIFEIDITPPTITIYSPLNQTYNDQSIWFNVTLDEVGSWCGYSLDGAVNVSMDGSGTEWHKENTSMALGSHNVTFSCNDIAGNMNASEVTEYFTVYDATSINTVSSDSNPNVGDVVNLSAELFNSTEDAIEGQNVSFYYNGTYIGSDITNSSGWAVLEWDTIGVTESGVFFINVTYPGNSTIYADESYNDTLEITMTYRYMSVHEADNVTDAKWSLMGIPLDFNYYCYAGMGGCNDSYAFDVDESESNFTIDNKGDSVDVVAYVSSDFDASTYMVCSSSDSDGDGDDSSCIDTATGGDNGADNMQIYINVSGAWAWHSIANSNRDGAAYALAVDCDVPASTNASGIDFKVRAPYGTNSSYGTTIQFVTYDNICDEGDEGLYFVP